MPTYREWIKATRIEDIIGGSRPSPHEIDRMTYAELRDKYGGQIIAAAKKVGLDLTADEMTDIIYTIFPIEEWPAFRPSHYDRHC